MPAAFTKKFSEDSSEGQLQFSFYCDICRKECAAPVVEVPNEKGLFQKWKSQKAYEIAFEDAQRAVKEHFNLCRACNRWVCDECFRILPSADICIKCAEKQEKLENKTTSTGKLNIGRNQQL